MLTKSTVQLMALGLVGSFAATAAAQDSGALIDALVRKGVLKDQEAEQIRTQLSRDYAANTPAGKLNLSSSVKELKLSGDVRARWQYDNRDTQAASSVDTGDQRSRFRLRLRVNADYKLNDNFFAGFGLQTEQKNDSGNQTMAGGAGGTGTSAAGDYYQNYPVFISKAFVGWTPFDGVTLIAGKQVNPFYTTDLVWDADINPTGFVQRVDLHKFLSLGSTELSLVAGQFAVSNSDTENLGKGKGNRDAWAYQTQLIAGLNIVDGVKVTVAPGFYCTNAANVAGDGGGEQNFSAWANGKANQTDGLKVILAPGDVSFKVAGKPVKFQWDFAYNRDATDRSVLYGTPAITAASTSIVAATNSNLGLLGAGYTVSATEVVAGSGLYTYTKAGATTPEKTVAYSGTDSLAYLVGFAVGENKKKGDWSLLANYRQVGLSAVDPNINDSDWSLSYTNMAGYKVGFMYNLGDATTLGATYYSGNNLRHDLGVIGASAGPGSGRNSVQVLQVDMSVKF